MATDMQDDVQAILQGIEQTRAKLNAQKAALCTHFENLLAKSLAVGMIFDANDIKSPGYHAKTTSGRAFRPVYRIEGPVRVRVDGGHPILSKWFAKAISIDNDGVRTLGKPLEVEGSVFPLQAVAQNTVNADAYILRLVKQFEEAQA